MEGPFIIKYAICFDFIHMKTYKMFAQLFENNLSTLDIFSSYNFNAIL